MKSCIGCKYAEWKRTKAGRLHPDGDGECTYEVKIPKLPNAKHWAPYEPSTTHGFISRKKEFSTNCPCFTGQTGESKELRQMGRKRSDN